MPLEIHIPENWPPESGMADGAAPLWQLRDAQGRIVHAGHGLPDASPQPCSVILPAARVTLSRVRPPRQNRGKFMQALAYAVEDRIMADPESVHVAPGPLLAGGDMPVAIVERAWLRRVLDALNAAGLRPERAESEIHTVSLRGSAWSMVWRGNGGFLRQDAHAGMVLDGGGQAEPPLGLKLALDEAGVKPACIDIYNDMAPMPDVALWSSLLGVPVKAVGEWARSRATDGINLLQGDFAPDGALRDWLPHLRPAAILVGALAVLHVAFSVADWAMLRYEKATLMSEMEQDFRRAFPEAKAVVDAPLQMSRNLAGLRHAAGQPDSGDFLALLGGVAPLLGGETTVRHLDYQPGGLKIGLQVSSPAALEALKARLPASARLESGEPGVAQLTIGAQP